MSLVQYESSESDSETCGGEDATVQSCAHVDSPSAVANVNKQLSVSHSQTDTEETRAVTSVTDTDPFPVSMQPKLSRVDSLTVQDNSTDQLDNFFFNDSSDSEDEIERSRSDRLRVLEKHSVQHSENSAESQETPDSLFWRGHASEVSWTDPAAVWGPMMKGTSRYSQKLKHQSLSHSEESGDISQCSNAKIPRIAADSPTISEPAALKKTCFFVHHKVKPYLHTKTHNHAAKGAGAKTSLIGHGGAVNRIQWGCPQYSHMLLSVSMDSTVKIWNVFSTVNNCVQVLSSHNKAVRDCKWTVSGTHVLTCGYDRTSRHFDVEKGVELHCYDHPDFLSCIDIHPVNPNCFIIGSLNCLYLWDLRCSEAARKTYTLKDGAFGQVLDVVFNHDGTQFFASNNIVCRDSADRNLMAWDFGSGVVLSNQIYQERYTCPRLCMHPHERTFMAQTNGDYIALFSTVSPYKMHKGKRFEGHKVAGYNVGCDISPDGTTVVSGGSDGRLTFYNYQSGKVTRQLKEGANQVLLDVAFHPVLPSTVAASTWGGSIFIYS